jgi:hypothetical protein
MMKFRLSATKLLYALIVVQLLIGVFSIITLSIGRAVAVFGSAALIYLGLNIINQLTLIRELLSYAAVQTAPKKEALLVTGSIRERLQERFAKREPAPKEDQPKENQETEVVYTAPSRRGSTPTSQEL